MPEQKVAIVTGASRGLGAALAQALAKGGYAVACAARATRQHPQEAPGTLDDVLERIQATGGTAISVPVDLADRADVATMVERTVKKFGRLDILVNNAANGTRGGLDIPLAEHDSIMAVNLDAPFIASRHAVPHLRAAGGGRILNISSLFALRAFRSTTGSMSYGIAKIGVERLTLDLARQLADDGTAVNCLRVDTPIASEGAQAHAPDMDLSDWITTDEAAEGLIWMLNQPVTYTGQLESMRQLAIREGIMPSVAAWPGPIPVTSFP
jgi:NAD(P)-dependent dehydrogenase (short-subunit alcohol dehydrogenase family)